MRTIKMIGLDLDGTLLNREKKLTTYSKEILKEAICQGMIVLVATGRPLLGVPDFMREFPGDALYSYGQWSEDLRPGRW